MEGTVLDTLRTLRDIKGVQGSFVLRAGTGQVVGRDLPALLDDAILGDVGPRIDRLFSVVDAGTATDSIAMRFGDQRLDIRRMGAAHLCVLAEAGISQPALRMAMKLVCRRLESESFASASGSGPPPPNAVPPAPGPVPRMYRGSRIG